LNSIDQDHPDPGASESVLSGSQERKEKEEIIQQRPGERHKEASRISF
jgi:hypothetical protein